MIRNNKGFTLIELMIVVAIISVLVGLVVVAINPVKMLGEAKDGRARSDLNQVKAALQLYHNENSRYPTAAEMLTTCTTGATICFYGTYMRQPPTATVYYANDVTNDSYIAGVDLDYPSNEGNDSVSYTKCGPSFDLTAVSPKSAGNSDYFICPD
jgi:prepilin-type N-terminal cleavage/methylation domain-containing protein